MQQQQPAGRESVWSVESGIGTRNVQVERRKKSAEFLSFCLDAGLTFSVERLVLCLLLFVIQRFLF